MDWFTRRDEEDDFHLIDRLIIYLLITYLLILMILKGQTVWYRVSDRPVNRQKTVFIRYFDQYKRFFELEWLILTVTAIYHHITTWLDAVNRGQTKEKIYD